MAEANSQFVFATCQVGAENTIKNEVSRDQPDWRLAFSRPGFLTFKLPTPLEPNDEIAIPATFVRSYGLSLGKATGAEAEQRAAETWALVDDIPFDRLHVWSRDRTAGGPRVLEPAANKASIEASAMLCSSLPTKRTTETSALLDTARRGDRVLDCVLVEPNEWWIGIHVVNRRIQRWPGGIWTGEEPQELVSRAYFKMAEALDWICWPMKPGQRCVELGCAPGGASQALLRHGMRVVGIDPATVDPRILAHPDFQHIRKRGADLKRREYREFQWLVADMNVAPAFTLNTVANIVNHRSTHILGLILNLKFADWQLAENLPEYLDQIRSWGYTRVRARQLSSNRQEVCVAALKPPRRPPRRTFRRSVLRRPSN